MRGPHRPLCRAGSRGRYRRSFSGGLPWRRGRTHPDRRHGRDGALDGLRPRVPALADVHDQTRASAGLPPLHRVLEPRGLGDHVITTLALALAAGAPAAWAAAEVACDRSLRGNPRAGAARRDRRPLRPQPVARDHPPPALVHARRARGAHAARGVAACPRGSPAARDRAARRARAGRRCDRARGQRTAATAADASPGAPGRRSCRARLVPSRRLLARARGRGVRDRLPVARRLGRTRRSTYPWLVRGCAGLLAILAAQMVIGEMQYRTYGDVPWWLVLLHVATAATSSAGRSGSPPVSGARSERRDAQLGRTRLGRCRS